MEWLSQQPDILQEFRVEDVRDLLQSSRSSDSVELDRLNILSGWFDSQVTNAASVDTVKELANEIRYRCIPESTLFKKMMGLQSDQMP